MASSTRSSVPDSEPADPVPDSVASRSSDDVSMDLSHLPEENREAIRRLRRQVDAAVETIRELRAENERLRKRVEDLEAQPKFPDDKSVFSLDEEPDVVKERITRFIEAIDTYLEAGDASEASNGDPENHSSEASAS